MIDKIVITLNDSGKFDINIGDIQFITEHNTMEALRTVNNYIRKLAHFPTGKYPMTANPITYEEFNKKQSKNKKS
jgi:hypothetical protein